MLDWMKAVGMCLIVYGHVAAATTVAQTPPVYLKQFGVAFFLFAMAFTLARETRPVTLVLFNRLFPVYLFAGALALLVTAATAWTTGRLALSNYLPLLGGANVLFDNFPANPTTWFVGTYLHILVLWALVIRHLQVRSWMIGAAFLVEIPVRALLMTIGGGYIAYMLLTNWIAVFLLGLMQGAARDRAATGSAVPFVAMLLGGLYLSLSAGGLAGLTPTFPFMTVDGGGSASVLLVSSAVSVLYLGVTGLAFEAARRLRVPAPVRFIARNSLIIFLAHMPVFYLLHPWLVSLGVGYWARVGIQLVVLLPGLGALSQLTVSTLQPNRLRNELWRYVMAQRARLARHPVGL